MPSSPASAVTACDSTAPASARPGDGPIGTRSTGPDPFPASEIPTPASSSSVSPREPTGLIAPVAPSPVTAPVTSSSRPPRSRLRQPAPCYLARRRSQTPARLDRLRRPLRSTRRQAPPFRDPELCRPPRRRDRRPTPASCHRMPRKDRVRWISRAPASLWNAYQTIRLPLRSWCGVLPSGWHVAPVQLSPIAPQHQHRPAQSTDANRSLPASPRTLRPENLNAGNWEPGNLKAGSCPRRYSARPARAPVLTQHTPQTPECLASKCLTCTSM